MSLIALVDDDASVRQATASLLRSLGHAVSTFESAEQFLGSEQLASTRCLITDVQMPGMSGIDLQARLKAEGRAVPVIVITAFPDERACGRAMQLGAVSVLIKPFSASVLADCVSRALSSN